jgi:ribosomal-protein-alanine N-acetyltransferase
LSRGIVTHIDLGLCVLRPWRKSDKPALVRHANDRQVWRNLTHTFAYPYTEADANWWFQHVAMQPAGTLLAIEVAGEASGGIGIHLNEGVHAKWAEIGYWLGSSCWGRGIATEAVRAMTAHAFARFDLIRLQAGVFAWNPASMRVLEKCGYHEEAILRRSVFKDGKITDKHLYVRFCDDPVC